METLINSGVSALVQVLVVLALAGICAVSSVALPWLRKLKQKDTLGIINIITDRAVEYAEQELKGAKGLEKRDFALKHATEILAKMGIKVSEDQLLADIQNGYNKYIKEHGVVDFAVSDRD